MVSPRRVETIAGTARDWQKHAAWQLAKISDDEYADDLVRRGEPADSPLIRALRDRGRPRAE